jgi:hypothetical protein
MTVLFIQQASSSYSNYYSTAMWKAAEDGEVDRVCELIIRGTDVNQRGRHRETALCRFVWDQDLRTEEFGLTLIEMVAMIIVDRWSRPINTKEIDTYCNTNSSK